MPHLDIRYAVSDDVVVDEPALAGTFTRLAAERLGKRAEVTAVRLARSPAHAWFVGARRPADAGLAAAHVHVQVTRGTNTETEKAAFIGAAFDALAAALGPIHPASYVVVEELDAASWGYGGRTQAARRAEEAPTKPAFSRAAVP